MDLNTPINEQLKGTGRLRDFDKADWSPLSPQRMRKENWTPQDVLDEIKRLEDSEDVTAGRATRLRRLLKKFFEDRDLSA